MYSQQRKKAGYLLFFAQKTLRLEDGTYLVESEKETYHFVTPGYTRFGTSCDCAEFRFCHFFFSTHRCTHLWASFYAEKAYREASFSNLPQEKKRSTCPSQSETLFKKVTRLFRSLRMEVSS